MTLSLSRLIADHVPAATALLYGGRRWTYGELAAGSTALGAHMADAGLSGRRVALMLPNGPEMVQAYLACFAAGAVAAPLNSRYAAPEVEHALRRAAPAWLVVHSDRLSLLDRVDPGVLDGVRVLVVGTGNRYEPFVSLCVPPGPQTPLPTPVDDHPAVLFFTSGSTGAPKGVLHSHRSALAMLTSTSEALGTVAPADVVQVCEPQVHASGFIATLAALLAGGTVALHDGFDLDDYVAGLLAHRPTLICTHVDLLAQLVRAPGAHRDWFTSLRGVYTGGDIVPAALQREFADVAGMPIGVGYGMTEAIWLTVARRPRQDRAGCIGTVVGGAELRADPQTGELLVRGPMVMQGYLDDEPLTRATIRDGWLRTGDLGSVDADGVWWFAGRCKDLIVRRTSKITPGEVEAALTEHPAVALAAVVAAPDPEEGQVPVAFVVLRPGQPATAAELLAFLSTRIAGYKLPARLHFRSALPLTPSGKVAHAQLHEPGRAHQ